MVLIVILIYLLPVVDAAELFNRNACTPYEGEITPEEGSLLDMVHTTELGSTETPAGMGDEVA